MNARRLSRRAILAALPATFAARATAQGFAGLGRETGDFANPERGTPFAFPADHAPHPAFRIEWWYVTANLTGPDGTPYGVQWTLFRSALRPEPQPDGWAATQAWMGHAALTTPARHLAAERLARGGIGQAGVTLDPFEAWIDDWRLAGRDLGHVDMRAAGEDFAFDLRLATDAPFIPQGDDGYSVKSPAGQASHYYSQPFYDVTGHVTTPEGEIDVTGQAWLDREWSSQPLAEDQDGWDWFSLHLDGGAKLMGFRLRGTENFTAATWIAPDGTPTPYPDGAFAAEPLDTARVADRDVPVRWRVRLPDRGLDVETLAVNDAAWMPLSFPYWEGPITFTGTHSGQGYLEMTGYG